MSGGCPRIVIAGVQSGVGKTSLALAIVAALTRRGLRVQTFKVGPDFLDPTYHAIASGRPCYNLDTWMCGKKYVSHLFERATQDADIAVIEGVMGLFDGSDAESSEGSTAEIARLLDAPVLLVTNAHGAARSLAAVVKGFCAFEPDVNIVGVVANHCGSERHAAWLADSLASASLPPLVGAIPREALPSLPSRHLGLVTADSEVLPDTTLAALADAAERFVQIGKALDIAKATPSPEQATRNPLSPERERAGVRGGRLQVQSTSAPPQLSPEQATRSPLSPERERAGVRGGIRIGLAYDEAFHFYYANTIEELERQGCEIVRLSPIHDQQLPDNLNALYIGGGYPEAQAAVLSANQHMLDSIRSFAASGRPVYVECGGLMYLSQGLELLDGTRHPMVGLLPAWTRMCDKKRALGYVEVTLKEDSLWGSTGEVLRGHEFHYSELLNDPCRDGWRPIYSLSRRRSSHIQPEGFQRGNVLASYAHLHLASKPGAIGHFMSISQRTAGGVR